MYSRVEPLHQTTENVEIDQAEAMDSTNVREPDRITPAVDTRRGVLVFMRGPDHASQDRMHMTIDIVSGPDMILQIMMRLKRSDRCLHREPMCVPQPHEPMAEGGGISALSDGTKEVSSGRGLDL